MSRVPQVSDAEFEQVVLRAELPVVVDFTAPWCPPCRRIAPLLDQLAEAYQGRLLIVQVDVDLDQRYASQLGIRGAPTLVMFWGGAEVERLVGAQPLATYQQRFAALVDRRAATPLV
ncbi:thioredoxin [Chloroflexia bacterium SDU3-3]|nr:thioredoxin [Chloroflexia bacterium SDU3-3]